jgi:hypothetical protein
MGDRQRTTRTTVFVLVGAVACTGLVGYLISGHAAAPTVPSTPTPSVAPPTTLPVPTAQPIANGFSVADDPATGQVVVFGGSSGGGGDTWVWTGATWVFEEPQTQPPPLSQASLVYDPDLRMVMLAGGGPFDAGGNDGTWGWDGKTWRELDNSVSQPGVAGGTMAWDPDLRQMILVTAASAANAASSQTWLWHDNRWIPKGSPAPFQAIALQMGFDESANTLIAVSCCVDVQPSTDNGAQQTWRWDGSSWQLLGTASFPSSPTFFGVGWDSITHSLLMSGQLFIGAQTPQLMPALMWRLVGHQWIALPGLGPQVSSAVLIETDDGLRLIGADSTVEGITTPYHIWAWTGTGWKQLD